MGYKTTLLFVDTYNKKGGFRHIEASLEMGKIAYDSSVENLIQGIRNKQGTSTERNKFQKAVEDYEKTRKEIYTSEGEHTEEMKELAEKVSTLFQKENKLGKRLPFVYWLNGNAESFNDCYGDLLLETTLSELKKAIMIANAKELETNNVTYLPYDIALDIIKHFENNKHMKVILYGH